MATTPPATEPRHATEQEPLLGRPGDVTQHENDSLLKNLVTGTAPLAQLGGLTLIAVVWGGVFSHPRLVFSAHPLLNSTAIFFAIQAILILQPTHTPSQKRAGTYAHAAFWALGLGTLCVGLGIVEWHKRQNGIGHFESPHAVLGLTIYALLLLQALVGFTQYFEPRLYGGVENAKGLYKYHRVSGYLILILVLVNVTLASLTNYAGNILGIKLWSTVVGGIFVVIGVFPRVKKQKVQLINLSQ